MPKSALAQDQPHPSSLALPLLQAKCSLWTVAGQPSGSRLTCISRRRSAADRDPPLFTGFSLRASENYISRAGLGVGNGIGQAACDAGPAVARRVKIQAGWQSPLASNRALQWCCRAATSWACMTAFVCTRPQ